MTLSRSSGVYLSDIELSFLWIAFWYYCNINAELEEIGLLLVYLFMIANGRLFKIVLSGSDLIIIAGYLLVT
jgi:hypothetical protein